MKIMRVNIKRVDKVKNREESEAYEWRTLLRMA
jgi:hypothetical protein